MNEWVKRIWKDPVGSKVISACILYASGTILSLLIGVFNVNIDTQGAFKTVFTFKINIWLAVSIFVIFLVISGLIQKHKEKNKKAPVPPFVNDFVEGYYQGLKWKWRWVWSPECKYYYIDDLNIECPNCHQGVLHLSHMEYVCVKCSVKYRYDMIPGNYFGVKNQIIQDARTKYSYCQEYIGKQPTGVERG